MHVTVAPGPGKGKKNVGNAYFGVDTANIRWYIIYVGNANKEGGRK
jgi:hypothetical protein